MLLLLLLLLLQVHLSFSFSAMVPPRAAAARSLPKQKNKTTTTSTLNDLRKVQVTSRNELRQWLTEHHQQSKSIWLITYKKKSSSPQYYVPYADIVEEALCFGWIDSLPRKLDKDRTMHLLSPRKPGSVWSAINQERVKKLQQASLMTPAGQAKVDRAKKDGSWSFLDDVEAMIIPADLQDALRQCPAAQAHFDSVYTDSVKKQALQYLKMAKQQSTRVKRIQKIVDLASKQQKFVP
jgi:uncharacterized protein YdeI (YjbR/CyaY-like superfamily)